MRGDFGRIRHNLRSQYTAVLDQQGRVALDADENERSAINEHLRRTETVDVIGEFGAPVHDAGFAISVESDQLVIGAGRYYVAGLLCENLEPLRYDEQPCYLDPAESWTTLRQDLLSGGAGATVRVFLEVWQRLVTALDDPCLREPALGQADTTVRVQTVWRVVAELGSGSVDPTATTTCCADMYKLAEQPARGSLSAQTTGSSAECGCQPVASAGYRGLENQLYRIEIHQSGSETSATFKWSRENGSVVVAIEWMSGANVTVSNLGPDANLGFQVGEWVELTDDTNLFGETPNQPGTLYQIQRIDPPSRTVTMTTTVTPVDTTRNARMRRWEQNGTAPTSAGVPLSASWLELENGIQVRFGAGRYVSGDFWTIPARTATGDIEWPPCGSDGKPFQPPHYARIHRAPLACIHYDVASDVPGTSSTGQLRIDDCRRLFPALTDITATDAKALHVTAISWKNDGAMTFDDLVSNGLTLTFDTAPDSPITPANFIVILETPMLVSRAADQTIQTTFAFMSQAPLSQLRLGLSHEIPFRFLGTPTVLRSETILDSMTKVNENNVSWTMPWRNVTARQDAELLSLERALAAGIAYGWPGRIRIRLLGRTLSAGTGASERYLDGQTFSRSAPGPGSRIELQLPSGDNAKASDFESWFSLYPNLAVVSASIAYSAISVSEANGPPQVEKTTPPAATTPITQSLTVSLNYAAIGPAVLRIRVDGEAGFVDVPSSVPINLGDREITVHVNLIGVPAVTAPPTAKTFVLTASVDSVVGDGGSASAQFDLTGVPAPVIIN